MGPGLGQVEEPARDLGDVDGNDVVLGVLDPGAQPQLVAHQGLVAGELVGQPPRDDAHGRLVGELVGLEGDVGVLHHAGELAALSRSEDDPVLVDGEVDRDDLDPSGVVVGQPTELATPQQVPTVLRRHRVDVADHVTLPIEVIQPQSHSLCPRAARIFARRMFGERTTVAPRCVVRSTAPRCGADASKAVSTCDEPVRVVAGAHGGVDLDEARPPAGRQAARAR